LAFHVSELEKLNRHSLGPNGRPAEVPPEPQPEQQPQTIEKPVEQPKEPEPSGLMIDASQDELEPLIEDGFQDLVQPEAEVHPVQPEPFTEQHVEEESVAVEVPKQNEPPKSGLLMKHLKPSPDEKKSAQTGPMEDGPSAASELKASVQGDDGAQKSEEASFDIESRLGISSKEPEYDVELEHLGESDSEIEVQLESARRERESSKPASWPPAPPSESDDLDEYK
jgi:hypothetical protein